LAADSRPPTAEARVTKLVEELILVTAILGAKYLN
jgi:hypothetical protein